MGRPITSGRELSIKSGSKRLAIFLLLLIKPWRVSRRLPRRLTTTTMILAKDLVRATTRIVLAKFLVLLSATTTIYLATLLVIWPLVMTTIGSTLLLAI